MFKCSTLKAAGPDIYECYRCPRSVRFMYHGENLEKYVIFLSKKDKNLNDLLYAAVFWPNNDKAALFHASASRSSGADYFDGYDFEQAIAEFGHIPNITPANIQEKFKLYMLFS